MSSANFCLRKCWQPSLMSSLAHCFNTMATAISCIWLSFKSLLICATRLVWNLNDLTAFGSNNLKAKIVKKSVKQTCWNCVEFSNAKHSREVKLGLFMVLTRHSFSSCIWCASLPPVFESALKSMDEIRQRYRWLSASNPCVSISYIEKKYLPFLSEESHES